jgi:hypothetical protein
MLSDKSRSRESAVCDRIARSASQIKAAAKKWADPPTREMPVLAGYDEEPEENEAPAGAAEKEL